MTGLIALDIFISLVFIFLLYSLLATTIVESITSFFSSRAKNLYTGIDRLLSDDSESRRVNYSFLSLFFVLSNNTLTHAFYNHPSIKYLGKKGINSKPSYISSEKFSSTLVDLLKNGNYEDPEDNIKARLKLADEFDLNELAERIKDLKDEINSLKPGKDDLEISAAKDELMQLEAFQNRISKRSIIKEFKVENETIYQLQMIWKEAAGDIEKFKDLLGNWYQEQMDRIVGWYKRKVSFLTFLVGFGLAFAFQVDTIAIANDLSKDEEMREMFVKGAEKFLEENESIESDSLGDTANPGLEERLAKIDSAMSTVKKYNAVIYTESGRKSDYWFFGYLITAFAISMGAPFWFDLLNKLVKLRSSLRMATTEDTSSGPKKTADTTKAVG